MRAVRRQTVCQGIRVVQRQILRCHPGGDQVNVIVHVAEKRNCHRPGLTDLWVVDDLALNGRQLLLENWEVVPELFLDAIKKAVEGDLLYSRAEGVAG